jgi:2-hydroxy-3-keto-5-methylthiopentenyl-1-phosphate phosphatase
MNNKNLSPYKNYKSILEQKFKDITTIYNGNRNVELLILADFDKTLTTGNSPECHGIASYLSNTVMKNKLNPTEHANFSKKLWNPKETNTNNKWRYRHEKYIESGFTEQQLIRRLQYLEQQGKIQIRKHVNETFQTALENNINIIIASAGIDNIIKYFFKDFNDHLVINHVKNRININEPKIYINAHTINFSNGIIQNIYPSIPDFHIEKEHLVQRMNFLQKKLNDGKILVGLMLGDSEVDFKIMNDYPLHYFIKIAFVRDDSSPLYQSYKNYIAKNCDIVLDSSDESAYEIIEMILNELIRIRDNSLSAVSAVSAVSNNSL